MVLHLGDDLTIPIDKLIMIISVAGMMPMTRAYVEKAVKERRYRDCQGKAKSYALVRERGKDVIYASMIAPATLYKRLDDSISRRGVFEAAVLTVE